MGTLEKYNEWIQSPNVPVSVKNELRNMTAEEIDDAFYKNIEFGTAGMRGILGPGTNRINIFTVRKATIAFGLFLEKTVPNAKEKGVVISHDNRYMSREFTFECSYVLMKMGFNTFIFDSLRPTPELSFAVRFMKAAGGVMITASHNPKEYNGYKVYDYTGCQIVPKEIAPLIEIINGLPSEINCEVPVSEKEGQFNILDHQVDSEYVSEVREIQINPTLNKKDFKIVYSPQHGASCVNALRVFKKSGYKVYPVISQCAPDPAFSGTLTPNPEDPRAYEQALIYAKNVDADLVCTTDPDGDRVGIAGKCRDGHYRLFNGNESAALLMNYIFHERERAGSLSKNGVMYNTIVTSSLGEKIASSYGVKNEQFLTGFKYIGNRIHYYEEHGGPDFEFGYEESYGCIISPIVRDKDGIQAILLYSEMALFYKLHNKTLEEQLNEIQEKFGYHHEVTHSIQFKGSKGNQDMLDLMNNIRKNPLDELCGLKVEKWNDYLTQFSHKKKVQERIFNLDASNVIKFFFEDGSTISIRPSGTEPKCKFYVEGVGKTDVEARALEEKLFIAFKEKYNII